MMKKINGILSFFLCLVLIISVVGCDANKDDTNNQTTTTSGTKVEKIVYDPDSPTGGLKLPATDTPIKVSYVCYAAPHFSENWQMIKAIKEKFNIELEVTAYEDNSSYGDKMNIMVASGTLPDVIYGISYTNRSLAAKLGIGGMLESFTNYLDYMPNFKHLLETDKSLKQQLTAIDGGIYNTHYEGYYAPFGIDEIWVYKKPVLDKYGIDASTIKTTDDLYNAMKKIKTANPDAYPFIIYGSWWQYTLSSIGPAFNTFDGHWFYDYDLNKWRFSGDEENYKKLLQYWNKLYTEGLVHPEIFNYTDEVFSSVYQGDGAFSILGPDWLNEKDPETGELWLEPLDALYDPEIQGSKPAMYEVGTRLYGDSAGFSINKNASNKEIIVQWIDYLMSDEGTFWSRYGVEGQTFEYGDISYKGEKLPIPIGSSGKAKNEAYSDYVNNTMYGTGFGMWGFTVGTPKNFFYQFISDRSLDVGVKYVDSGWTMFDAQPRINFSEINADIASSIQAQVYKIVEENQARFIIGDRPFSEWDDYVQEMNQAGLETLKQLYEKASAGN
jgi:putative aldouronate transport system substrate-binding protein